MLNYISTGVVLLFLAIAVRLYSFMPPQMITRWNFYGQADSYACRFCGLFTLPLLALTFFILAFTISRYSPYKKNIKKFVKCYDGLVLAMVLFLSYLSSLVWLINLGHSVSMNRFVAIGLGLLIFFIGTMIIQIKHNQLFGESAKIFTEKEWNKIGYLGGALFMIVGGISILGSWWPKYSLFFVLIPLAISLTTIFFYSYPLLGRKKKS